MFTRHRLLFVLVLSLTMTSMWSTPSLAFDDPEAGNPDATVYSPVFLDVPAGHLFEASTRAILAEGITKGCDQNGNRYCPDQPVTRGQMAAFLGRALDLPQPSERRDFADDDHSTFENDIERLAAAEITIGCNPPENTRFCPDQPVTRGQMAAFLTRALDLEEPPAVPPGVQFRRAPAPGGGRGAEVVVCRDQDMSLLVRSVTADASGLDKWIPSSSVASNGEYDPVSDRWFVQTGSGCESLSAIWDPYEVSLSDPLPTLRVNSSFGKRRHPILGGMRAHTGTDFQARSGDPVHASAAGVVTVAGSRGGYGLMVEIRHSGGLDTRYAHLSSLPVGVGDVIESGEVVGLVGCTGTCTGPHLHFETLHFGVAVDPMRHLG